MPYALPSVGSPVADLVQGLIGKEAGGGSARLPVFVDKVALVAEASPAAGGMFSWQNPLDQAVMACVLLDVTTPATGAATADIGEVANATTSGDTFMDAVDVGTAAQLFTSLESDDVGTNGKAFQKVAENGGASDFITGTASADSSGLVGNAYIIYVPIS